MDSVNIATARALVNSNAVNRAVIQCFDGRRWAILLKGNTDFLLRSERKNPKPFMKLETAVAEVKNLGLRHAELDFVTWQPEQASLPCEE